MRRAQRAIFPSRAWFGVVVFVVSSEGLLDSLRSIQPTKKSRWDRDGAAFGQYQVCWLVPNTSKPPAFGTGLTQGPWRKVKAMLQTVG